MIKEPREAKRLTATDVALMVGCHYEAVFRYKRELESAGVHLEAVKDRRNTWWFTLDDVEVLRQHQEKKPRVGRFGKGRQGQMDLQRDVLSDLRLLENNLVHLRRRVASLVKVVEQVAPSSFAWIATLPPGAVKLASPIPVSVIPEGESFTALCLELDLSASGNTRHAALAAIRTSLAANYAALARRDGGEALRGASLRRWEMFQRFISPEVGRRLVAQSRLGSGRSSQHHSAEISAWKDHGLSTRLAGVLVRAGITSLEQLVARRNELPSLPDMGASSLRSIDSLLLRKSQT